ncbi:hypothetical protein D1P53_000973 [Cryptococcus gattii VGV]|nr:hypothetical protein D1P53_000973 [Cryptococcus gattii VGV]
MSHPLTPPPIPFISIPISSSGHTPPYNSDKFHEKRDANSSIPMAFNVPHHTMVTNQSSFAYEHVVSQPPTGYTFPITVPVMSSQSKAQRATNFSFSPPDSISHTLESSFQPSSFTSSSEWQNTDSESRFGMDTEIGASSMTDSGHLSSSSLLSSQDKNKSQVTVPRPPNAWILYRSDMLKRISEGEKVPGIDKAREELGLSLSPGDGLGDEGSENRAMPPPPVKKIKVRKGAKMPTEDYIALGPGKGGKGLPQSDISKVISHLWKNEVSEIRTVYENRANAKKLEHQKLYPDYKFKPKRKAEKLKQRKEREREKQEARRLREEEKQAGKAKRRSRHRERRSPVSSRDTPSFGRTLAYDSESSGFYPSSFETSNMPDLPATAAQATFKRPFPLPNYAVPALPAIEGSPSFTSSQAVAHDHTWGHTRHTGPLMMTTLDLIAPPMTEQYSSDSLSTPSQHLTALPSPRQLLSLDTASYEANFPAIAGSSPESPVSDEGFQKAMLSITSAAHNVSGRPMAILDIDDISVLGDDLCHAHEDPAALAQAWWELDKHSFENDTWSPPSTSGLIADGRTSSTTALEAGTSQDLSSNIISITIDEGSPQRETLDATDHDAEASQLPLMIDVAYQNFPTIYQQPIYYTAVFDSNSDFLGMTPVFEPTLFEQAPSSFDQGPFLSIAQPLSPTETYSAGPTPRESTFLQAGQDFNRMSFSPTVEGTVRTVSAANTAPRHVSSSAYPLTPLSMDTMSLPSVTGTVDRNTSFSALTAVLAGHGMGMMGEDMLAWDEDEFAAENAAANASVVVNGSRKRRESVSMVNLEPIVQANTPTSPVGLDA